MKKAILLFVAIAAVIAFTVPGVFATTVTPEQEKIDAIYTEMLELRKQLIDSYVASGQITEEQGALMKERMDAATENRGNTQKRGFRMGGGGCGVGGGAGAVAGCGVDGGCVGGAGGFGADNARQVPGL